jgi:hypothetical protein
MAPNGSASGNGAIRYTYNAASQLIKVEAHSGSTYAEGAEMSRNDKENCTRLVIRQSIRGVHSCLLGLY